MRKQEVYRYIAKMKAFWPELRVLNQRLGFTSKHLRYIEKLRTSMNILISATYRPLC